METPSEDSNNSSRDVGFISAKIKKAPIKIWKPFKVLSKYYVSLFDPKPLSGYPDVEGSITSVLFLRFIFKHISTSSVVAGRWPVSGHCTSESHRSTGHRLIQIPARPGT